MSARGYIPTRLSSPSLIEACSLKAAQEFAAAASDERRMPLAVARMRLRHLKARELTMDGLGRFHVQRMPTVPFLHVRTRSLAGQAPSRSTAKMLAAALLLLAGSSAAPPRATGNRSGQLGVTATVIRPLHHSNPVVHGRSGVIAIENIDGAELEVRGGTLSPSTGGSSTLHWTGTSCMELTVTY